jgi:hypothetical protein
VKRHRLNRGGNREANAALYRAVVVRLRWHAPTVAYVQRRTECWKPTFARYLTPQYTGLQRDLVRELHIYNTDRAHQGRRNKGLTPGAGSDRP